MCLIPCGVVACRDRGRRAGEASPGADATQPASSARRAGFEPAAAARQRPRRPGRPGGVADPIVQGLRAPDEDARYAALDRLVRGWPSTRPALGEALRLLREDGGMRGGVALSLARLGGAVVPHLLDMVRRAPADPKTLLGAGVLAYHLVSPTGLVKRPAAERHAIRASLGPLEAPLRRAFLADRQPDYEILQGVAAFGERTVTWLLGPAGQSGRSRTALVLYLLLSDKPEEVLLEPAERARLRARAAPLARPLAEALVTARADGTGERPDALVLGLSVLGDASARALLGVAAYRAPARCPALVKVAAGLAEQRARGAVRRLRPLLARCAQGGPVAAEVAAAARSLLAQGGPRRRAPR